jgi:hypothetical protein
MNKIDYQMNITFNDDQVEVKFTGEGVRFEGYGEVRPRHIRLVVAIMDLMKDVMKP